MFGSPRHERLRDSADFERVYERRLVFRTRRLWLFARRNDLPNSRWGLSVSRKHGGAVVRNRLKRLLREAIRSESAAIPMGWDIVLIPQPQEIPSLELFREALRQGASFLARRDS